MRLVKYLEDSINDQAILKSIFLVGSPGAGKSHVLKKVGFGSIMPRVVNSDKWTEWFGQGSNVDWAIYGDKIEMLTLSELYNYTNAMLPLFIDSTSSKYSNTVDRNNILKSLGYDTGCIFVNTSFETALARNAKRKRKVPEDFLKDTFLKVQKLKLKYQVGFKFFKEIRNDDGELTDEVILKAFKQTYNFFAAPVENELGKKIISELRETKGKYLIDLPRFSNLKSIIGGWYK